MLPPWALLFLRLFISIFCVGIIITSTAQGADARWLIYLTNWSYLLLTLAFIGLTLISISHVWKRRSPHKKILEIEQNDTQISAPELPDAETANIDTQITVAEFPDAETENTDNQITVAVLPDAETNLTVEDDGIVVTQPLVWYEKVVWFLWLVSSNAGLIVTIEYWSLVFRPPTSFMDISVHALNSIFILTELFTGKLPVRILHYFYVMIFSIVYALFTVFYWVAGGVNGRGDPYIYNILDYQNGKPGIIAAVLLCSIFILSPLVQFTLYVLYKLRHRWGK